MDPPSPGSTASMHTARSQTGTAAGTRQPTPSPSPPFASPPPPTPFFRPPMPYDQPIPSGRCAFAELPEEVLELVLMRLDLHDLSRCFRLSKAVNHVMTASAQINVRYTLLSTSMTLNPAAINIAPGMDAPGKMPLTSASMLSTLRERTTRFKNLQPLSSQSSCVHLAEGEGSLYEYLEGVLLRSVARPGERGRTLAVYDLRTIEDWEDVDEDDDKDRSKSKGKAKATDVEMDEEEEGEGEADNNAPPAVVRAFPVQHTTTVSDEANMVIEEEVNSSDWHNSDTDSDMDDDTDDDDEGQQLLVPGGVVTLADILDDVLESDDDDEDDEDDDEFLDLDSVPPAPAASLGNRAIGADHGEEIDPNAMGIRREQAFDFTIIEMAVDPGQDLLVLLSPRIRRVGRAHRYVVYMHLFSLSTFDPHPEAASCMLEWPYDLQTTRLSFDFQICDDYLFVLMHLAEVDHALVGFNWRTGKQIMSLKPKDSLTSFNSFVLLSPSSFVVTTMRTHLSEGENEDDLPQMDHDFTNHLELYAFPEGEDPEEPYEATHVATIDLPRFKFNLQRLLPVYASARTDPPPRKLFPKYPLHAPPPFAPDPTSGVAIFEIRCRQMLLGGESPMHFVLFILKATLLRYMPAPTSPLLRETWSRPVPVVPWEKIAPYTRLFGPDMSEPNWVCYVYQYRFVTTEKHIVDVRTESGEEEPRLRTHVILYDFDPLRVRKERCDRMNRLPKSVDRSDVAAVNAAVQGEVDGVELVLDATTIPENRRLDGDTVTGASFPYIKVSRPLRGRGGAIPLIDSERIVIVREADDEQVVHHHLLASQRYGSVEIMQF